MSEKPLIDVSQEKILSLTDETKFAANGIVSRTLLRTTNTRVAFWSMAVMAETADRTQTCWLDLWG